MPLGMEIGLGPCDIVLDGDQPPQKRHGSFMRFPPYFYFRFGRRRWSGVVYRRFCNLLHQISRLSTIRVAVRVERGSLTPFPVLTKPEIVFSDQTVADWSICYIKVE